MKKLTAFCKKLQLRQILTVFLVGMLLIFSTACGNAKNAQGANPNNPAVQAGGANNPYKSGGDNYNNLKMSTDPKVTGTKTKSQNDQASITPTTQQLIAASSVNKENELLYPGAETPEGRIKKESELPVITGKDFTQPDSGGIIQREPEVTERAEMRTEKVQEAFKEATRFAKEKADEAGERPEFQSNPALRK